MHSLLTQQHTQVRTGALKREHAWPCRGRPTPCHGRDPGRVAAKGLPCRRPPVAVSWAQCRAPTPCRGLASRPCSDTAAYLLLPLVIIHSSVLRYKIPQPPAALVMIQFFMYRDTAFSSQLSLLSQYTNVYCDTMP